MNSAQLLDHFDRIAEAPDAIPRLRRFILDLAVRGKLVEQDPRDEPASELLVRIKTDRPRLSKGGEKTKALLPELSDEDWPFELPHGWWWVRFGEVYSLEYGDNLPAEKRSNTGEYPVYGSNGIVGTHSAGFVREPCIVVGRKGSAGALNLSVAEGCCVTDVAYYCIPPRELDLIFSFKLFHTLGLDTLGKGIKPGLNRNEVYVLPVAVPPLAEQYRIVAKVDELMALCDRLEAAQAERESQRDLLVVSSLNRLNNGADSDAFRDHARFYFKHLPRLTTRPEQIQQLRQTILNLAVRGRLVPQDPSDEPASELLRRIQAEKMESVKRRNMRKLPLLYPLDETQAPFALPPSWVWARFPELGIFGRGKSKHRPRNDRSLFDGGTHLLIQTGDVARSKGVVETFTSKYNEVGLAQSAKWPKGTLCITIAANIADSGILSFDACFPDSVVGFIPSSELPSAKYFEYFIRTTKSDLLAFAPATAQKNINLEILNSVLIPLPPLAEQQRIVAKVDELMSFCDKLEAQLTITQTESRRFFEAVLHEALTWAGEKLAHELHN